MLSRLTDTDFRRRSGAVQIHRQLLSYLTYVPTQATGIVVLPGAFVGAVFGGGSVPEAAAFQLLVLASLLAGAAVSLTLWSWIEGAPARHPA